MFRIFESIRVDNHGRAAGRKFTLRANSNLSQRIEQVLYRPFVHPLSSARKRPRASATIAVRNRTLVPLLAIYSSAFTAAGIFPLQPTTSTV